MATVPIDSHSNHDERRPFFTSRQLADYLALSERTVRELLRTGAIPSYKVSGARRIDPADVDIWLAGCREEGKAACVSTERHRCRESTPPGPSCGSRATRTPLVTARATFKRKRDAQAAIDAAYGRAERIENVGGYFQRWPRFHPRTERTQRTNEHRITRALDIELDGVPLRVWAYTDLRRRHALALIDVLLTEQGRSALGATHIIRALSVMTEDAITDEVAEVNPFKGVAVRANDPRVSKRPRPVRVFTFEQMHAFARAGGSYEPMLRTFADTGMRLGEVLALRREDFDGRVFQVRRTAHNGRAQQRTKTDHGESGAGRIVPCPAELAELIRVRPARIHTALLFPTLRGKIWWGRNFYRDVWAPAQQQSGLDIRPHEMRHSYVTHLRAARIDDADLAAIAGHTVQTMIGHYTHALRRSFDQVRQVIGRGA